MNVKRIVSTGFWEDDKVLNDFSVEDRYFMLYLLTNPHTTQLGIYNLNVKYAVLETGFNADCIKVLLDRFENKYNIIICSKETNEVCIKNYLKYSIVSGGKPVLDLLVKESKEIKDRVLFHKLLKYLSKEKIENQTVNDFVKESLIKENIQIDNVNDNHNDNDNEESYHESYHESYRIVANNGETKKESNKIISTQALEIFKHWNSKSIIVHKELNDNLLKEINKALKDYDIETIKLAIDRYDIMLKDKSYKYCTYQWSLKDFLKQKNAMPDFLDDGSKWNTYSRKHENKSISIFDYGEVMNSQQEIEFDSNYNDDSNSIEDYVNSRFGERR